MLVIWGLPAMWACLTMCPTIFFLACFRAIGNGKGSRGISRFGQNRSKTCPIQIPFINARHLQMFIPSDDPVYYICIPLYTSTTWYDDMWRKNNNIIHSIQWSLERTIYNPKIWCYDQNDNALWYILTTILMPWLFLSWKRKKKSI